MVNTFIVYYTFTNNKFIPDYKKSAESLDISRLRKQCVEAKQILNILLSFRKLLKLYEFPKELKFKKFDDRTSTPIEIQCSFLERISIIKKIRKIYLDLDFRFAKINNIIYKFPKNKLPFRLYSKDKYEIIEDCVIVESKKNINYSERVDNKTYKIPRDKIILPGDELYTLGFSQHAIVKMWIGYEDSLKMYINKHIDAYCSRFKKNGESCSISIKKYTLPEKIQHPWWLVFTNAVVMSHRASLLRKEPSHYSKNKDFTDIDDVWKTHGYVWTGSLKNEKSILDLLDGKNIPKDICAEISKSANDKNYIKDDYGYVKFFYE